MEHLLHLITYKSPYNKCRFGCKNDGGYVIAKLESKISEKNNDIYDAYISAGVSDEESFSRDFIEEYRMKKQDCFAFDNTIHDYPYEYTSEITFVKKNIGPENTDSETNLKDMIERYENIFLKMDIEGSEYPWLSCLSSEELSRFKQITMEFHGINDNTWNTSYRDKLECFRKLAGTHKIVHVHGNNWGCVISTPVGYVPNVIEITFVRNSECTNWEYNTEAFPIADLDNPNKKDTQDYKLNFPPFCYPVDSIVPLLIEKKEPIKPKKEQKIPRQIFQTWKTKNMSQEWIEIRDRMLNKNPDYKYELFDDQEMDQYIEKTQCPEIVHCYRQLNIGASRADFWRYIILYERGGVYVDIDSEITGNLDELIESQDRAIISREGNPGYFLQWMMIFEEKHPILRRAIEICVENIQNRTKETVFHITGPDVFTRAIKEYTCENAYEMDDMKLNNMFSNVCRFYSVDYPSYGIFKHDRSDELYVGNLHWQNETQIYKRPICTDSNLGMQGRLGNVLFQYAGLLGFAERIGGIPRIPKNIEEITHHSQKCLLKQFQISALEIETEEITNTYIETCDGGYYDEQLWSQRAPINLQGQFESELYFYGIKDQIKKEFRLLKGIEERVLETTAKITENGKKKLLGIHFRRGDDVNLNNHVYTTEEYNVQFLKRALKCVEHNENIKTILFTGGTRESLETNKEEYENDQENDKNWCIEFMRNHFPNLNAEISPTIDNTIEDFGVMQQCDYFIINSASSMGWWAGYLNEKENKKIIVGNTTNKSNETFWCSEFINIDK